MPKQPKAFAIMNSDRTAYYAGGDHAFRPLPAPDPNSGQVTMPDDAWIGYYAESRTKCREARSVEPSATLVEIGEDDR